MTHVSNFYVLINISLCEKGLVSTSNKTFQNLLKFIFQRNDTDGMISDKLKSQQKSSKTFEVQSSSTTFADIGGINGTLKVIIMCSLML